MKDNPSFEEEIVLFQSLVWTAVQIRDSLLPHPENWPGTQAGKERVLYYLQAHARNGPIISC